MKILFLTSSIDGGGAERVAVLLSNVWASRGDNVTIMPTFSGRGGCSYTLERDVSLEFLADQVSGNRSKLRRIVALRGYIRRLKPDVIVSFLPNVNVAALVATIGIKIPVIVSERNNPVLSTRVDFPIALLRRALYRFSHSVVVQNVEIEDWVKSKCGRPKTNVIPNPVVHPVAKSSPVVLPQSVLPAEKKYLVAVGRMVPAKRFNILLSAFQNIAERYPQWSLVVLGDGPEREALGNQVENSDLKSRVYFPGFVGNIGDWYEQASVFVMCSAFEGFPNCLIEAMSYGLPCVTFDIKTGPKEITDNGNLAILLPDDDHVKRLTYELENLLAREETRHQLGGLALRVREKYTLKSVIEQWDSVLSSAMNMDRSNK